jgi:hypothetical protein
MDKKDNSCLTAYMVRPNWLTQAKTWEVTAGCSVKDIEPTETEQLISESVLGLGVYKTIPQVRLALFESATVSIYWNPVIHEVA